MTWPSPAWATAAERRPAGAGSFRLPAAPADHPPAMNLSLHTGLRGAYDLAENPRWGSYETFSNATSGFGSVKNITIKNVSTKASGNNTASVGAIYTVTDKQGVATDLDVSYGLKYTDSGWKITSYTINSSQK